MICPLHGPGCSWYQGVAGEPDSVDGDHRGADLGYGDGHRNGTAFAQKHPIPFAFHLLPISDGRGDDFALGWLDGLVARWCVVCDTYEGDRPQGDRCLARWPHRKALLEWIDANPCPIPVVASTT